MLPLAIVYALTASALGTTALVFLSASIVVAGFLLYQRTRLAVTLRRYISPEKARQILTSSGDFFRTERRNMSVLFCDIRGNTAVSEQLEPAAMFSLLNDFHSVMIAEAFRGGATVDKLLGDGLMLLFGAPIADERHAERAVSAAAAMQLAHRELQRKWDAAGLPAPGMGVGIASGDILVGNLGSEERLDYTAVGRYVNLASKLCGVARAGEVVVSPATEAAARAAGWETVRYEPPPGVGVPGGEAWSVSYEDGRGQP
jgi:adenylate cyclase